MKKTGTHLKNRMEILVTRGMVERWFQIQEMMAHLAVLIVEVRVRRMQVMTRTNVNSSDKRGNNPTGDRGLSRVLNLLTRFSYLFAIFWGSFTVLELCRSILLVVLNMFHIVCLVFMLNLFHTI